MAFWWRKKDQTQPTEPPLDAPAQESPLPQPPNQSAASDSNEAPPPEPEPPTPPLPQPPTPGPGPEPAPEKQGFFSRLAARLAKTKDRIGGTIDRITLGRKIDDQVLDELEEALVTADLGVKTATSLIDDLRGQVRRQELNDVEALKIALRQGIQAVLDDVAPIPSRDNQPHVIMVVGVNGVGKTTTIAKLARHFQQQGRRVLLGAADTFRAAAAEQLEVWAGRVGCDIVRQQSGADPSAVAYDAIEAALSRSADLVIIDTAGRLHTKVNLMEEMKKIQRVMEKRLPGAPHEVLLVLDATTGQNAISQAKLFHQAVPLTGLVLTKLDGTAKGGVVIAIAAEMKLPILFVGLGEGLDDLRPFEGAAFAEAIF